MAEFASELKVRIRVTEGDAMFDSLCELAELTRQHAELSERISTLSKEIREMIAIDAKPAN